MSLHGPRSLAAVFAALSTAACSNSSANCGPPPPTAAPIAFTPALVVGVSDSITGKPLADSANGMVQWLTSSDSLRHGWLQTDSILYGVVSGGTYTITVQRTGYAPWVKNGVVVAAPVCYTQATTNLTARLKPTG